MSCFAGVLVPDSFSPDIGLSPWTRFARPAQGHPSRALARSSRRTFMLDCAACHSGVDSVARTASVFPGSLQAQAGIHFDFVAPCGDCLA